MTPATHPARAAETPPRETAATPAPRSGRFSGRLAGGVVVAVLFLGSTLLTPLYDLYRQAYRLSGLQLALLYAVYVVGNLAALLFLGRLSDQLGRRPVVLAGLGLAVTSAALCLFAAGPAAIFAARIVSGCAVGLGSGAATAWIAEATPAGRRAEAASAMTSFNFAGLALGVILAACLVQFAPWPLRLPFGVYIALAGATAALVFAAPETLARSRGGGVDLRPRLGVPTGVRLAFVAPAAAGFAAMAVVGFYAALGPTMIRESLGVADRAVSGLMAAALFVVAAAVILATRRLGPRPALLAGLLATPPGLGLLALAQAQRSATLMLAGTALCGLAAALSYRGGLAAANALAPADRRAEVASSYFVCCFLGNALPIVGVGALAEVAGSLAADRILAAGVAVLAAVALVCARAFPPPPTSRPA